MGWDKRGVAYNTYFYSSLLFLLLFKLYSYFIALPVLVITHQFTGPKTGSCSIEYIFRSPVSDDAILKYSFSINRINLAHLTKHHHYLSHIQLYIIILFIPLSFPHTHIASVSLPKTLCFNCIVLWTIFYLCRITKSSPSPLDIP